MVPQKDFQQCILCCFHLSIFKKQVTNRGIMATDCPDCAPAYSAVMIPGFPTRRLREVDALRGSFANITISWLKTQYRLYENHLIVSPRSRRTQVFFFFLKSDHRPGFSGRYSASAGPNSLSLTTNSTLPGGAAARGRRLPQPSSAVHYTANRTVPWRPSRPWVTAFHPKNARAKRTGSRATGNAASGSSQG